MTFLEEIKTLVKSTPIENRLNGVVVYKIKDLIDKIVDIPKEPGVYFVGRSTPQQKMTLCKASDLGYQNVKGGWYENKEAELEQKKEKCKCVVYIGKTDCKGGLKTRISAYMRFIKEMKENKTSKTRHRGGRIISLIKEVYDLDFCWISIADLGVKAKTIESLLLEKYGKEPENLPLANRQY